MRQGAQVYHTVHQGRRKCKTRGGEKGTNHYPGEEGSRGFGMVLESHIHQEEPTLGALPRASGMLTALLGLMGPWARMSVLGHAVLW